MDWNSRAFYFINFYIPGSSWKEIGTYFMFALNSASQIMHIHHCQCQLWKPKISVHTCHNSRIIASICIIFDRGGFLLYSLFPTSQPYNSCLSWCTINCKVSNKWGSKEHNNYCLQESVAMQCGKLFAAFQRNPLPPLSRQTKSEDGGRMCL